MFLLDLSLIVIIGVGLGFLLQKIQIPKIIGYIAAGIILGPVLNLIKDDFMQVATHIKKVALIIIITRSGLKVDFESLKQFKVSAFLLSCLPASFEIVGISLVSYFLLDFSINQSIMLGSMIAAVSPAIVVPKMIELINNEKLKDKKPAYMILVGSSLDDIFVIFVFFRTLANATDSITNLSLYLIPVSIISVLFFIVAIGFGLYYINNKYKISNVVNFFILFVISALLYGLEHYVEDYFIFPSLVCTFFGFAIFANKNKVLGKEIESNYKNVWIFFEILLFGIVGSSMTFDIESSIWWKGIVIIFSGLFFRAIGTFIATLFTKLSFKQRLFIIVAYIPKATVQASLAALPLAAGIDGASILLAITIISILITAPIGGISIDLVKYKLLDIKKANKKRG